ncbi:TetR/AcrR family transcriptional regulator [Shewanella cyperi]|uniref:TetR/AcrR family transcriptional regulator n=1 Tax=Shewanella cyperi TaxID=2814292 RepID=A0A974XIL2_9GAMM|nr:TetR/AcrR family transcriptional regulator [Shewanella cyperi]QSX29050.1 TetR/AcrR family transcriptional regulator [Shewanella cyperi]QSX39797.1 TetR/AcrR family transcriptional regulator [Shewanella cyperi]
MRTAEYDREQVLRQAMKAFMAKGFAKTSMQDLTRATGLHPGSIYCAFDNKRGLLLAALEQYQLDRGRQFEQFFSPSVPALTGLRAYLDNLVQECSSCESDKACLLTKTFNEVDEEDAEIRSLLCDSLRRWQQGLEQQFARAIAEGELAPDRDPALLAQYLVMGIYGLRTYAQAHPQGDTLAQLTERLYQDLCR